MSDSSESVNSESTQGTAKRMFLALFCYGSNIAIISNSNFCRFVLLLADWIARPSASNLDDKRTV